MNSKERAEIRDSIEEEMDLEDQISEEMSKDEYIEKLNEDLKEQQLKTTEYYDHLKRSIAEFDNFKKRINKEKDCMYVNVKSDIISDLLPVLDNFEKALNSESKDESFRNGMKMIYKQMEDLLIKFGVEEIKSEGMEFDPNLHEAVMHIQDKKFGEKEILEVFRKGYKIGDKIIRHAIVKLAN